MHGIRSNKNGFEFAFGPSLVVTKEAEGFYQNGNWTLLLDWEKANPDVQPKPTTEFLFDSRGLNKLSSSFVFAFGKSFKSGRLNIPVNAFFIPNRGGHRFASR